MKHWFTLIFLLVGMSILAQEDSPESDTADYELSPPIPKRAKRLFITASYGYGTSYHSVSSEKYAELVSCRGEHEKNLEVPSAELNVGYHIKHWWNVSVGLEYFETGFNFSEEKSLSDTMSHEFSNGCDVYNSVHPYAGYVWYGFHDPRFVGYIQGYHPTSATQKINVHYYYLGIPVKTELSFTLSTAHLGYLRPYVVGGLTPNYMIRQQYDASFENGTWKYVQQDSIGIPYQFLRRGNVSTVAGFGLKFFVKNKFDVSAEYNRQDQLLDIFNWRFYDKQDYEEKHRVYRVKFAVTYYFGD